MRAYASVNCARSASVARSSQSSLMLVEVEPKALASSEGLSTGGAAATRPRAGASLFLKSEMAIMKTWRAIK